MGIFFSFLKKIEGLRGLDYQVFGGPILILIILSMLILPLPSFILDVFFTFNITISIMILLVSMFTREILNFSAFPTILLFSTVLRLGLNVASTRVILLEGHKGSFSAGKVVEAFGHFLVGGNFAIGIVVFIILVIINFVVITKGASRVAEVSARFILDAMPGKQMAIDADLNAGLIGEEKAKKRRKKIEKESDFYGSMDGASKFVRGDAIAGILIMIVNICGGLIIGVFQHDMLLEKAAKVYSLLTIGDGLVAQIPALVISTAAGVIVTRVSTKENAGEQIFNQLFYNPDVLLLSSVVIGILGFIPGMPNVIFLLFSLILFLASQFFFKEKNHKSSFFSSSVLNKNTQIKNNKEPSWKNIFFEDPIRIELGEKLLLFVKREKKEKFIENIRNIRKKMALEIGFLPPLVRIKNNLELSNRIYRILINGVIVGTGKIFPNSLMAIDFGQVKESLIGKSIKDPVFKLPAYWIDILKKEEAIKNGYVVVEPETIIITHLKDILYKRKSELFGRKEVQQLLKRISEQLPKLVEDLIPNLLSVTIFHRIIQNLLLEEIPIKDMRTILEVLLDASEKNKEVYELTSLVRIALRRIITQKFFQNQKEIHVIGIDFSLEEILLSSFRNNQNNYNIEPNLVNRIVLDLKKAIEYQNSFGFPLVLLVNHEIRFYLSHFLRAFFPNLNVLSNKEIEEEKLIFFSYKIGKKSSE